MAGRPGRPREREYPPRAYVPSQAALRDLLGCDPRTVSRLVADHPEIAVAGAGYLVPRAVEALVEERSLGVGVAAGDSPALERYREARARLAERDADEADRVTIRLDDLQVWWSVVAGTLRRAVEAVERRWGPGEDCPGAVVRQALEAARLEVRRRAGKAGKGKARC